MSEDKLIGNRTMAKALFDAVTRLDTANRDLLTLREQHATIKRNCEYTRALHVRVVMQQEDNPLGGKNEDERKRNLVIFTNEDEQMQKLTTIEVKSQHNYDRAQADYELALNTFTAWKETVRMFQVRTEYISMPFEADESDELPF